MKRLLLATTAFAGLFAASAAWADDLDGPIATAPAEVTEYVRAPETTAHRAARADGSFQLASILLTGAGKSGGSIAVAFVPNAILTTQAFSPKVAASAISDSSTFVLYFEFRCAPGTTGFNPDSWQSCQNGISLGNWLDADGDAEHNRGLNFVPNDSAPTGGLARFNINNNTTGSGNSSNASYAGVNTLWSDGNFHSVLWYGDVACSSAASVRCGRIYIDGALAVDGLPDVGTWTGTQTIAFAANPFYLNAFNGTQAARRVEFGRVYLATNLAASPVVGSTNAPSFTLANFGSAAAPVDFGATGTNPIPGTTPKLYFCNPAATYITNCNGVGPDATAAGQLGNSGVQKAFDAPLRPGETPDRPYPKWVYYTNWSGACGITSPCTAGTNAGWKIDNGDLVCLINTVGTSGATTTFAASGYTDILGSTINNGATELSVLCKTWSGGGVAAGSIMTAPTFTFTNGGSLAVGTQVTIVDFGKYGAGGTTPTVVTAIGQSNASTSTLPLPDVTAPAGKSLWCGVHASGNWTSSTYTAVAPPATSYLVNQIVNGGVYPIIECEKINAAGTVSRTAIGNPGIASVSAAIILN